MRRSIAGRIRLLKSYRLYSTKELAEEVGVHPRTVQQWQKEGLSPIDPNSKPYVYRGCDAKAFLIDRRQARKQKLNTGEFFCTKCRKPVRSRTDDIHWEPLGSGNRLIVRGKCAHCGVSVNLFASRRRFTPDDFVEKPAEAESRLCESRAVTLNTDISEELNHE